MKQESNDWYILRKKENVINSIYNIQKGSEAQRVAEFQHFSKHADLKWANKHDNQFKRNKT